MQHRNLRSLGKYSPAPHEHSPIEAAPLAEQATPIAGHSPDAGRAVSEVSVTEESVVTDHAASDVSVTKESVVTAAGVASDEHASKTPAARARMEKI